MESQIPLFMSHLNETLIPNNGFWNYIYIPLLTLSLIFSLIVPIMFFHSPKTRKYPAILYLLMSLSELMLCYSALIIYIFSFWQTTCENFLQIILNIYLSILNISISSTKVIEINNWFVITIKTFQYCMYGSFCIDILISLQKPFYSINIRFIIYVSFIIIIILARILTFKSPFNYIYLSNYDKYLLSVLYVIIIITLLFIIKAIFKAQKIQNKKIKLIKIDYLQQNFWLLIVLGIYITFGIIINFYQNLILEQITMAALSSSGIIIGLIRFKESFFRAKFKLFIKYIFGSADKKQLKTFEKCNEVEENWCIPLAIILGEVENELLFKSILEAIIYSLEQNENRKNNSNQTRNILKQKKDSTEYVHLINQNENKPNLKVNSLDGVDVSQSLPFIAQSTQKKVKVIEYASDIFQILRENDNISSQQLVQSFKSDSFQQITKSEGRSGAFFYFSPDRRFILKTLDEKELKFLINNVLKQLFKYLNENTESSLARIYGCFTIEIDQLSQVNLILMENTLIEFDQEFQLYDLKGSLYNRFSKNTVKKDLNLINSKNVFIRLDPEIRSKLLRQLEKDTQFLENLNIMDYSMLLAISKTSNGKEFIQRTQLRWRQFYNFNKSQRYSIALIDYLQNFNFFKLIEFKYKTQIRKLNLISCIAPKKYKQRFLNFINSIIIPVFRN